MGTVLSGIFAGSCILQDPASARQHFMLQCARHDVNGGEAIYRTQYDRLFPPPLAHFYYRGAWAHYSAP